MEERKVGYQEKEAPNLNLSFDVIFIFRVMVTLIIVVFVMAVAVYMMKNTLGSSDSNVLYTIPQENEASRLARTKANRDREQRLLTELDLLIKKGDKQEIRKWLEGYYNFGNKVPGKVYAKAMTFIEEKKWLTDEEYKVESEKSFEESKNRAHQQGSVDQQTRVIYKLVEKTIDILLDWKKTENVQKKEIETLLMGYKTSDDFYEGILKFGYWHAMHIIMNSKKVSESISKKVRSDRQRNMGALTRQKITIVPAFVVSDYLAEAKIILSSADIVEYQNFAFINFRREFDLPDAVGKEFE